MKKKGGETNKRSKKKEFPYDEVKKKKKKETLRSEHVVRFAYDALFTPLNKACIGTMGFEGIDFSIVYKP